MKRIILGKMNNARDLGGYPTHNGYTQYMRFIRCDAPKGMTESDFAFLLSHGITTVIDLRNDIELSTHPNVFQSVDGFSYKSCPMFADGVIPTTPESIPTSYLHLASTPEIIGPVLQSIASAPKGVLFHCTAGKDRTGVVAAVLLWIAGADKADILADYIATQAYLLSPYRLMLENNPDFPFFLTKADMAYIEDFFDAFQSAFESSDDYMSKMGLTRTEAQIIKNKLLNPNAAEAVAI